MNAVRALVDASMAYLLGLVLYPVLWMRNHLLRTSVVDGQSEIAVCLTSYGVRLRHVHLVIESIAWGRHRPGRLVLWVARQDEALVATTGLRRLVRRGLEIRLCNDTKSHKKYFPFTTESTPPGLTLVTADDDVFYPRDWIEGFVHGKARDPEAMWCYRSRRMRLAADRVHPYASWPLFDGMDHSPRRVPTGVSGVLHPPALSEEVRARGTDFEDVAPVADDLWLHALALVRGIPIRQLMNRSRHFAAAPWATRDGLMRRNIEQGNDEVAARLYTQELRNRILDEGPPDG